MYTVFSFFLSVHLLLVTLLGQCLPVKTAADGTPAALPLHGGADPWYLEHEGVYYYCHSAGNGVAVRQASSMAGLKDAESTVVYRAPGGTMWSQNYWAPELHYLNGGWYIYVAADDGENENHRMYVLQGDSPTGPFTMVGKLCDETDRWAIDGTVLQYDNELYFVWSGWEKETDGQQNLYIAHMSSPTRIDSPRHLLSEPTHKWETKGMPINEGPAALYKDGRVYLVYSASGSWTDDYCLGMLRFTGGDILNKDHWAKCPVAVFTGQETALAPGHCSFVQTETEDYIVYHANLEPGTGWNARSVRAQPIRWICGVPVFGNPLPAGSEIMLP